MGCGIAVTKKCCHYVNQDTLRIVAESLILCHLSYCTEVWSSASKKDLTKIQVVQNKAARLVLGCSIKTSRDQMYSTLSWLTLNQRIIVTLSTMIYNTLTMKMPISLFNQIVYCNSVHSHNTRKANNGHIMTPYPKTNFMKKTFLYRAIVIWNNIPIEVHQLCNKLSFKSSLRCYVLM